MRFNKRLSPNPKPQLSFCEEGAFILQEKINTNAVMQRYITYGSGRTAEAPHVQIYKHTNENIQVHIVYVSTYDNCVLIVKTEV